MRIRTDVNSKIVKRQWSAANFDVTGQQRTANGASDVYLRLITCMVSDDADDPRLASRWG